MGAGCIWTMGSQEYGSTSGLVVYQGTQVRWSYSVETEMGEYTQDTSESSAEEQVVRAVQEPRV